MNSNLILCFLSLSLAKKTSSLSLSASSSLQPWLNCTLLQCCVVLCCGEKDVGVMCVSSIAGIVACKY